MISLRLVARSEVRRAARQQVLNPPFRWQAHNYQAVRQSSHDRFAGIHKLVEDKKLHYVMVPEVMDDKDCHVKKWLVKEGDSFTSSDPICELAYPSMTIEFTPESSGILAEMLANEGQPLKVNTPFAVFAANAQEYADYFDGKREAILDAAKLEAAISSIEKKTEKHEETVTPLLMMRHIKHLIQRKEIDGESAFAKQLQALARTGNKDLADVFAASFDGETFNESTFDNQFFLSNAQALVKTA